MSSVGSLALEGRADVPALVVDRLTLASLPSVIVSALVSFDVIHATLGVALAFGVGLLVLDRLGWRVVSALFDRERLITGTRS